MDEYLELHSFLQSLSYSEEHPNWQQLEHHVELSKIKESKNQRIKEWKIPTRKFLSVFVFRLWVQTYHRVEPRVEHHDCSENYYHCHHDVGILWPNDLFHHTHDMHRE